MTGPRPPEIPIIPKIPITKQQRAWEMYTEGVSAHKIAERLNMAEHNVMRAVEAVERKRREVKPSLFRG